MVVVNHFRQRFLIPHDQATRTLRPAVGGVGRLLPAPAAPPRRPLEGRPHHAQWHLLAAQHRRPLARPARALRALADRLPPLHRPASERPARPPPRAAPAAASP